MPDIVGVSSVRVGAGRTGELISHSRACRAVVAHRAVVTQVVCHFLVGTVVLRRAKLNTIERVNTLERVVVSSRSRGGVRTS